MSDERRIFVVGTGRCGTSTFYQAARHITNYTTGHESAAGYVGIYAYPPNHIEIAGRLAMTMGGLIDKYYPKAKWVHLIRDREPCVKSLASQAQVQLDAFARHWFERFQADPLVVAGAFYDCVNANIRRMLPSTPTGSMTIRLETAAEQWICFWRWIGAEGDFEQSRAEWGRRYNSLEKRGKDVYV